MIECHRCGSVCEVKAFGEGFIALCPKCKRIVYNSKEYPEKEVIFEKDDCCSALLH